MVFYDYERDGKLNFGETLLIYDDGRRLKVSTAKLQKLERKEDGEPREPADRRNHVGGRPFIPTQHKQKNARRTPAGKRIPLHKVKPEQ